MMDQGLAAITTSIAMIAVFLLIGGGIWMIAMRGDTKKGFLMIVAAAVLLANVLIWTI